MNVAEPSLAELRDAAKEVEAVAAALDMYATGFAGDYQLPAVGVRRRRLRAGEPDPVATVSLVRNDEGVLLWREGAQSASLSGRRRLRGGVPASDGELVELYQYEKLEPNQVSEFLSKLDDKLNADRGLFQLQLRTTATGPTVTHAAAGPFGKTSRRRLLLVHGTFSTSRALLDGMVRAPNGAAFMKRVFDYYDEVLAFEHPTLSVSPVLNAYDLSQLMTGARGPLDVIAHSRGGLVTRWCLEGFSGVGNGDTRRAVLVGSPLGGTSLASPPRLRSSLSLLSNIGTALKLGGAAAVTYFPLLAAPLALLRIASSVVSVAARTPVIDAGVAMIPGLAGQSRVASNHELDRVRAFASATPPTYFVVQANFETESPGWRFWKWFRGDRIKDAAADKVFPGSNDLVVDTSSMTEFTAGGGIRIPSDRIKDFGTTASVHHTNYFEQAATLDFMLDRLQVP
jgi:hypothetical protein